MTAVLRTETNTAYPLPAPLKPVCSVSYLLASDERIWDVQLTRIKEIGH